MEAFLFVAEIKKIVLYYELSKWRVKWKMKKIEREKKKVRENKVGV